VGLLIFRGSAAGGDVVLGSGEQQIPFDFAQGRLSALSPRFARLRALGMTGFVKII